MPTLIILFFIYMFMSCEYIHYKNTINNNSTLSNTYFSYFIRVLNYLFILFFIIFYDFIFYKKFCYNNFNFVNFYYCIECLSFNILLLICSYCVIKKIFSIRNFLTYSVIFYFQYISYNLYYLKILKYITTTNFSNFILINIWTDIYYILNNKNIFSDKFTILYFFNEYNDVIDWNHISCSKLDDIIIHKYYHQINWKLLLKTNLNLIIIEKYYHLFDYEDWEYISIKYNLNEDFIRKFCDKLDWKNLSQNQILSEKFILEFQNHVYWRHIALFQNLSEKFIENNICKLKHHHPELCKIHIKDTTFQNLSLNYILKYRNEFDYNDWEIISACQKLTENFIIKFNNKIHWDNLGAKYPLDLSINFLHTYKNKINWYTYFKNQKILYTKQFLLDFLPFVDDDPDNEIKNLALKRYYIGKFNHSLCKDICLLINSFI
jgi:hypothetical protein